MSLIRVVNLARNTFREVVRDKIYYVLFGFSFALICLSTVLGQLSVGESRVLILDFTYFTMEVIGALISVFVGITLVHREIEKKTIYNILSKPVRRSEFVLGKFLGLFAALLSVEVIMFLFGMILLKACGYKYSPVMVLGLISILIEIGMVLACAVLFSVVSSPIVGGVFTLCFYVIGNIVYLIEDIYNIQDEMFSGLGLLYYLLPNFHHFDFNYQIVHLLDLQTNEVVMSLLYGVLYSAFILCIAVVMFERKDIS